MDGEPRYEIFANNKDMYSRKPSLKESFLIYCQSQKGRELSMATSIISAISVTVVGLAVFVSHVLPGQVVEQHSINQFFIVIFMASLICLSFLLGFGFSSKLTIDENYKEKKKSNFMRGGVLVLASGGLVYYGAVLSGFLRQEAHCRQTSAVIVISLSTCFVILQVIFIFKFSQARINGSLWLSYLARFLVMQVIATNLCVWLKTVITETVTEITKAGMLRTGNQTGLNELAPLDNASQCSTSGLDSVLRPYTFPLLIEFSAVSSTMLLAVWDKCGTTAHSIKRRDIKISQASSSVRFGNEVDGRSSVGRYYNTSTGFVLGWIVLLASFIIVVIALYDIYSDKSHLGTLVTLIYSTNLTISSFCLVAVPLTGWQMAALSYKDEEVKGLKEGGLGQHGHHFMVSIHRKTDQDLLSLTFLSLAAYKILSIIAGYEQDQVLLFMDGMISIFAAAVQSIFINWFGNKRRTINDTQRLTKPGRQTLELLRCCNLSLWLINTFLLKHSVTKFYQDRTFGSAAWSAISNILQPLVVLHYFHSTTCIAEIIMRSYSDKYIHHTN